jgi:hypothetical protein
MIPKWAIVLLGATVLGATAQFAPATERIGTVFAPDDLNPFPVSLCLGQPFL